MRKIDDRHFGPDSVGKIDVSYQNVKRTKSKGSIKGKFVLRIELYIHNDTGLYACSKGCPTNEEMRIRLDCSAKIQAD